MTRSDWFYFNVAHLLIAASCIQGCRVQVQTSEYGSVSSLPGSYKCPENNICYIDVNDGQFNETFVAEPSEGYVFRWWGVGNNSLCSEQTGNCELSAEVLSQQPWGAAILESDEVFYLRPVFTVPHGSTPLNDASAEVCFNPSAWKEGYSIVLRYSTPREFYPNSTTIFRRTVYGQEDFEGVSATKVVTEIVERSRSPEAQESIQTSYITVDLDQPVVTLLGAEVSNKYIDGDLLVDPVTTFVSWYDLGLGVQANQKDFVHRYIPGLIREFDMSKDEIREGDIRVSRTTPEVSSLGNTRTVSWDVKSTVRYEGIQSVTVPAGDFEACRFKYHTITHTGEADERTVWIDKESGVTLIETASDDSVRRSLLSMQSEFK